MDLRLEYTVIFSLLIIAEIFCAIKGFKSDKDVGKHAAWLNISLIGLLVCNILITDSTNNIVSYLAYIFSYISTTFVLLSLVNFTNVYCQGTSKPGEKHRKPYVMYILVICDIIQLLVGIFTKHVISIEYEVVDSIIYIQDMARIGLTMHRIIDYILFICVILIFLMAIIRTSKLYREKFAVIFCALLMAGSLQLLFIVYRSPIDKSVIAHALIGILLYYLAVHHRPLRLLDTMLSTIAFDMNDSVFVFDNNGECVWANEKGYALVNVEEGNYHLIKPALINMFGDLTDRGDNWSEDILIPETDQAFIIEKKSVKSAKIIDGYFVVIKDSTERRKAIQREMYNVTHDELTGIHNQYYLFNKIKEILNFSKQKYCVIFINIKNFKIVNDIFGHKFGDKCIIQLAKWLKRRFENDNEVEFGRLVGDTFGIFMPVEHFKEEVFTDGLYDFTVKSGKISQTIPIHVGVYNIKDPKLEVAVMFDRAHLALSNVNDNYKTCLKYYDDDLRQSILEEQKLVHDLNDAIAKNQIQPYFQPIIDKNNRVVGAEALARWIHPELGFLPPYRFIPLFEKNGMIADVDRYIWECTCGVLTNWKDTHPDLFISINISPKDFYFMDVVYEIKELVKKYDIDANKLRIEITETAMIEDVANRLNDINKLREAGFIIEMDDFGAGYSSLNMLKNIPVDVLKIDMGFLNESEDTNKAQKIVYNVIAMSKDLDVKSLTEGVETLYQYEQLSHMGCELFQGYYFAKPMPIEEFEQFIINHNK